MVYDADQDDYNVMPEAISEHCAGFISRTEAHSSQHSVRFRSRKVAAVVDT